jgi:hypothetical protein
MASQEGSPMSVLVAVESSARSKPVIRLAATEVPAQERAMSSAGGYAEDCRLSDLRAGLW